MSNASETMLQPMRVYPSAYFIEIAHPTSSRPAVTSANQASGGDMLALRGEFQQMRVMTDEERAQQLGIIRPDRGLNTWPLRKLGSPLP
jgi:hypothetical protein